MITTYSSCPARYSLCPLVFGVPEIKPRRGFPPGKVLLRFRNDEFAQAFVHDESGIRHFYIEEEDGFWQPSHEVGRNARQITP